MEALIQRLNQLRNKKGASIEAADVDVLLSEVVGALASMNVHMEMLHEIEAIAEKIRKAKEDMQMVPVGAGANLKGANLELDEVIKATEDASNKIMDAAEKIQSLAPENTAIMEQITEIFEACSFQDITGQRIRKVLGLLGEVEIGIQHVMAIAGVDLSSFDGAPAASGNVAQLNGRAAEEAAGLLNGPQLSRDQSSQDDIDKLFGGA